MSAFRNSRADSFDDEPGKINKFFFTVKFKLNKFKIDNEMLNKLKEHLSKGNFSILNNQ